MIRKLEEWERPVETLKNGKTFHVETLLTSASTRYRKTKRNYNLGQPTVKIVIPPPVRYTVEDATFMFNSTLEQICERYNCSHDHAQRLKYYVPLIHDIK